MFAVYFLKLFKCDVQIMLSSVRQLSVTHHLKLSGPNKQLLLPLCNITVNIWPGSIYGNYFCPPRAQARNWTNMSVT